MSPCRLLWHCPVCDIRSTCNYHLSLVTVNSLPLSRLLAALLTDPLHSRAIYLVQCRCRDSFIRVVLDCYCRIRPRESFYIAVSFNVAAISSLRRPATDCVYELTASPDLDHAKQSSVDCSRHINPARHAVLACNIDSRQRGLLRCVVRPPLWKGE